MPFETRRRIPPIFAAHCCQEAITLLTRSLATVPVPVRHAAIRALSKLKAAGPYDVYPDRLDAAIEREVEHFAALGQIVRLAERDDDSAWIPVALDRLWMYREEALERIFRLLGLRYDQRDLYDAYLGLTSAEPKLQDSAVEFVDNVIDYGTRRYLLPLLDDPAGEQATRVSAQFFDRRIHSWEAARRYLETADDPRLDALIEPVESSAATDSVLTSPPDPTEPH